MFFKIGAFKNFVIFTGKRLCWSLFLIKLQAFCEYCEVFNNSFFYRTSPVATSADVLFYIIFSKRFFWIYCSYTLHNCFVLKLKITLICLNQLCHSLQFVVPLVVILCPSLLLVVIHCPSLSFVVTLCPLLYYLLSLIVIPCTTRCHSL